MCLWEGAMIESWDFLRAISLTFGISIHLKKELELDTLYRSGTS